MIQYQQFTEHKKNKFCFMPLKILNTDYRNCKKCLEKELD